MEEDRYFVVRRQDERTLGTLHEAFTEKRGIPVLWDRRVRERRQVLDRRKWKPSPGRRQAERRGPPPTSWTERGFIYVAPRA